MALDTQQLRQLVTDVLANFQEPHDERIIGQVFVRINDRPEYLARYTELRDASGAGERSVNPMIGKIVHDITGMRTAETHCTDFPGDIHNLRVKSFSRLR